MHSEVLSDHTDDLSHVGEECTLFQVLLFLQNQLVVHLFVAHIIVSLISRSHFLRISHVTLKVQAYVTHLFFKVLRQVFKLLLESLDDTLLVQVVILFHLPLRSLNLGDGLLYLIVSQLDDHFFHFFFDLSDQVTLLLATH